VAIGLGYPMACRICKWTCSDASAVVKGHGTVTLLTVPAETTVQVPYG
jgi:hypothetical protein